ncbi:MAG: hypothetical protein AAF734_07690, partial [Bacteroidota bacterium]
NDTQYNRLEEVKKLIFGEEIKAYTSELDNLKKQMESYRTEISVKIDEVKIELLKSIESLEQKLIERVAQFQSSAKQEIDIQKRNHVSKASLGNIFEEISKTLSQ